MSRNQFENNEHIATDDLDGKVSVILPQLEEGQEYAFEKLSDGRTAVIVEEDNVQRCTCSAGEFCSICRSDVRDQFGRKYAGQ